jgi:hypothetical protein
MARPNQVLPLFGIEWEHLPSLASMIRTLKFVSFPSFSPFQSFLTWCLLFQGSKSLKKSQLMVFPNFELWWRNVLLQGIILTTIQEMWRCPISQHVLLIHCAIYLWIFLHISRSFGISYMAPLWKNIKWKYL